MKKKGYIILSIISMIIIITLGASLAFSGGTVILGEKKTSVKVGDLTFRYVEKNRKINLEDTEPISDASGKALNNYFEFDIEANLVGSDLIYEVDIESLEGTTINPEGIKIYLTEVVNNSEVELNSNYDGNGKVKTISNYSNGILYQERVLKNTKNYKKTYRVRMWIDEEIDWSDDGYIGEKGLYIINVNARSNVNMIDTSVPVPEITGGNNSWTTSTSTIRVLSTNPVVGGIEKYEYYITQDEDDVPNDITIVTGETTTGEIVVNRVGKNYVYYRLVTSGGERGNWSSRQVVYYDNTEYTITYNLNSGTQGENAVTSYTVETNTFSLPEPTKTGYTFSGWYENSSFTGNAVTQIEKPSRGNKEYYAKWTANTYYVRFNSNTGTGTMANETFTYGETKALASNSFAKSNYTFAGWATSSTAKAVNYVNGSSVTNLTTTANAIIDLYAIWVQTASFTFGYNGSNGSDGSIQTFNTPVTGYYKLEVWGAQGGSGGSYRGGYGGYSVGVAKLTGGTTYYIGVGGQGVSQTSAYGGATAGGYNGGGYSYCLGTDSSLRAGAGGGATHIATANGLLSTFSSTANQAKVLIVAGGGAGGYGYSSNWWYGNSGGGYEGVYSYDSSTRGTQSTGFRFGQAGDATAGGDTGSNHAGGGGGWYGGKSAWGEKGAGGGSGYIGNSLLLTRNNITKQMYCYSCTANSTAATKTTSTTNVSGTATTNYAKSGHGYAKITWIRAD